LRLELQKGRAKGGVLRTQTFAPNSADGRAALNRFKRLPKI
jgi:hypothetical protein